VNNKLVTIRRAANHFHGICLEGIGKVAPFVRIVRTRELPRAERYIAMLFDGYNLSF